MNPPRPKPLLLCLLAISPFASGCGPTIHPTFDSPEPAARNAAIVHAAAANDRTSQADLVRMLESDDPATRLLAITTLERMTGQTHGYRYTDPDGERKKAIEAWRAALATSPSAAPGGPASNIPLSQSGGVS